MIYRMDELYYTAGPPLTYNEPVKVSDPVFLLVVIICVVAQVLYISFLMTFQLRQRHL